MTRISRIRVLSFIHYGKIVLSGTIGKFPLGPNGDVIFVWAFVGPCFSRFPTQTMNEDDTAEVSTISPQG